MSLILTQKMVEYKDSGCGVSQRLIVLWTTIGFVCCGMYTFWLVLAMENHMWEVLENIRQNG